MNVANSSPIGNVIAAKKSYPSTRLAFTVHRKLDFNPAGTEAGAQTNAAERIADTDRCQRRRQCGGITNHGGRRGVCGVARPRIGHVVDRDLSIAAELAFDPNRGLLGNLGNPGGFNGLRRQRRLR